MYNHSVPLAVEIRPVLFSENSKIQAHTVTVSVRKAVVTVASAFLEPHLAKITETESSIVHNNAYKIHIKISPQVSLNHYTSKTTIFQHKAHLEQGFVV